MMTTGTTCLFVTFAMLLCSCCCTEVNRTCNSTRTSWLLVRCSKGCFRASRVTCNPCPSQCVTCRNSTYCTKCIDGRWGPTCNQNCRGCILRKCSIQNGRCLFEPDIILYPHITLPVPASVPRHYNECIPKSCDTCKANDPRFCVECSNGSYVTDIGTCEPCSQYCKDRTCYQHNGTCISGCIDGWKGPHCTEDRCGEKGYYRDQDECLSCPLCSSCRTVTCVSSCCEVTTPTTCGVKSCNECKANDPRFCVECSNGSYVTDLGSCEPCSQKCTDRSCDPYNGTCLLGCIDGRQGTHCKENACANSSCGFYRRKQDEYGNRDESGENSMVIGAGIGSAIFVLVVVVIVVVVLVRRNNRMQQKSNAPIQTEAGVTDINNYQNITSDSNNRSAIRTTNQNTELQTFPETSDYQDVDNIDGAINTYEALGNTDEHFYATSTKEALGAGDEPVYSNSFYEALGPRDEHLYGKSSCEALRMRDEQAEEPTYINKIGV